MNESELARSVAVELGGDIATELEHELHGRATDEGTRALGITEAIAVASFPATCAQLAVQFWQARQDRALLLQALVEKSPDSPRLDPERRLGLLHR